MGTLTDVEARQLEVPLAFLGADRKYAAHIYEDTESDGKSRTNVKISRRIVDRSTTIRAALRPSDGQAIRIVPAKESDLRSMPAYRRQ